MLVNMVDMVDMVVLWLPCPAQGCPIDLPHHCALKVMSFVQKHSETAIGAGNQRGPWNLGPPKGHGGMAQITLSPSSLSCHILSPPVTDCLLR